MRGAVTLACALLLAGCADDMRLVAPPAPTPSFADPSVPLRVDIRHADGMAPQSGALEALQGIIREVGNDVQFDVHSGLPRRVGGDDDELVRMHLESYPGNPLTWRDLQGRAVLQILYVNGTFQTQDGHAAGLSFVGGGFPLLVLFPEQLRQTSLWMASVGIPDRPSHGYERATLLHEYGHALGLVNCGLPQGRAREDLEQPCHSSYRSSVMWHGIHVSEDPREWALDDEMAPVWRFDEHDWSDIRAFQAAGPEESVG